jgi:hypothetical protein
MVLQATGDQVADTTLILKCQESGNAGPGRGSFVWRYATDSLTQWRGAGAELKGVSGMELLDTTTTANKWDFPQAIRLSNDTLLICVIQQQGTAVCFTKARAATAWTGPTTIRAWTSSPTAAHKVCALQLPSGRILAFLGDHTNVITSYSDDNGATWTTGTHVVSDAGVALTGTPTSGTTLRFRCALLDGAVSLVVHTLDADAAQARDRLYQYASNDLGSTWDFVAATTGFENTYSSTSDDDQNSRGYHDIIVMSGRIMVFYLKAQDTNSPQGDAGLYVRVLGSAYQSIQSVTETSVYTLDAHSLADVSGVGVITGDLAVSADEDGKIAILVSNLGGANGLLYGESTEGVNIGAQVDLNALISFADSAKYVNNYAAVHQLGRLVMVHRYTSDTVAYDPSLLVTYVGGFTSLAHHPAANAALLYMPFFLPNDVGLSWTSDDSLTPAITATGNLLTITTNQALERGSWRATTAPASAVIYFDGTATSNGPTSGGFIRARYASGGASYSVKVLFNDANLVVSDDNGGTLATVSTAAWIAAASNGFQAKLFVVGSSARVYWRARSYAVKSGADHLWQDLGTFAGLANGGASTMRVQFGAESGAGIGASALVSVSTVATEGYPSDYSDVNPTALYGRAFSPSPAYVDSGTRINAVDGPAFYADQWEIDTRYTHGVENIHTEISPCPRKTWRSVGVAAVCDIIWNFDGVLNEESHELGDTLGISLLNINFRTAELWGYDVGTGAYVKIVDIDAASGQANQSFSRIGDTVKPATGSAGSYWYGYNALAGSHVQLYDPAGFGLYRQRKILGNSEGAWDGSATTKQVRLQLEGVTTSDPVGGGSMKLEIWSKNVTVLIANAASWSRFRLRIPVQSTAEGYFEIGDVVIGHAALFGQGYSWGRSVGVEQNNVVSVGRNGSRRVQNMGPSREVWEFAFTDGIDISATQGSGSPSPSYVTGYTGSVIPEASPADTPAKVRGIVDALEGATTPIVYLPYVPRTASAATVTTLNQPGQALYCRVTSDVRLESIMGEELSSTAGEVYQVATVQLSEEL